MATLSPLQLLEARVIARQSPDADAEYLRRYNDGNSVQGLENAPGATANGGIPPSPTMAPVAPPPAPASDPTPGSGGFGGIGSAMSRAMSGEGIIGTPDPSIDPMTGMPREIQRRANNQSIMKMGMMLMVAGMRNTDEGRAKMLSQLPGLMDNSDQVNNFAKTRLELAKVKLAEREMLTNEASSRAINAAVMGGQTTPMPGATVNPGGAAPVLDPSSGAGMPQVPSPMGGGAAPVAPAIGAPATGAAPSAPAPATAPSLPLDAPPPPPPIPQFQVPSAIALMAPGPAKTQAYVAAQREAMKAEYTSEPYIDTKLGKIVRDTYVAGRKTGRKIEGDLPTEIKDVEVDDQGTIERQHVQVGTGRIVKKENIIDPEHTEARVAATKRVTADSEKYSEEYEKTAQPSVASYERLGALAKDVKSGKAITGLAAGTRTWVANAFASVGLADPDTIKKLQTGALVGQQLRRAAGEFAKQYYGPQVSNQDVVNAEKVLNASMNNAPELVAQALEEMQREARKKVETYNQKADKHNERVSKVKHLDSSLFSVPKIEYDFEPKKEPLTPNSEPQVQPTPDQIRAEILRRRQGR